MKKYNHIFYLMFALSFLFVSCLKEEIPAPRVNGITFYLLNEDNKYDEVPAPVAGIRYAIGVDSEADIVSVWPGGIRQTIKNVAGTDSTDINGNVVLKTSDHYIDYGLLNARGLTTSLHDEIGWNASYRYTAPGNYKITIVATNHGYDSNSYDQRIFEFDVTIQ
jgi:hypothetical protein